MTTVIDPRGGVARPRKEPLQRGSKRPTGTPTRGRERTTTTPARLRARTATTVNPSRANAAMTSTRTAAQRGHWNPDSVALVGVTGLLTVIGLVFVLSASSVYSLGATNSVWSIFTRQLRWEGIGLVAFACSMRFGMSVLRIWWSVLWVMTVVLLLLVKFTSLGVARNGSTRWIGPRSLEIQPSEIAKLAVVASLAHLLCLRHDYSNWRVSLRYLGAAAGIPLLLVLKQPDLGTSIVIAAAALAVVWAGELRAMYIAVVAGAGMLFASMSLMANQYQRERITAFLHPNSEAGYHVRRSVAGIHAGGALGVGVGASRSKWGFLPNAHTDFIFSVITEEVGLVGAAVVIVLFSAWAMLGLRIAKHANDRFSQLMAFGITGWIAAQVFANLGAVTRLAPVTGVPLPFVSQGGTAFVSLMVAVGLLVDIARRGKPHEPMGQAVLTALAGIRARVRGLLRFEV